MKNGIRLCYVFSKLLAYKKFFFFYLNNMKLAYKETGHCWGNRTGHYWGMWLWPGDSDLVLCESDARDESESESVEEEDFFVVAKTSTRRGLTVGHWSTRYTEFVQTLYNLLCINVEVKWKCCPYRSAKYDFFFLCKCTCKCSVIV